MTNPIKDALMQKHNITEETADKQLNAAQKDAFIMFEDFGGVPEDFCNYYLGLSQEYLPELLKYI